MRADHPAVLAALERVQSASSLAKLLRNPLGFTWTYALGVRAPESAEEALVLDARQSGILLHDTLDQAVRLLEGEGGLAAARPDQIAAAIETAATAVTSRWEGEQAVPPLVVWRRTVEEAKQTALNALQHPEPPLSGQKSYTEVPFGGQLPGVTPHTLRHSFASMAADLGYSEPTIAAMLGHSANTITSRYVHHLDAVLIAAADKVAGEIGRIMRGEKEAAKAAPSNDEMDLAA